MYLCIKLKLIFNLMVCNNLISRKVILVLCKNEIPVICKDYGVNIVFYAR